MFVLEFIIGVYFLWNILNGKFVTTLVLIHIIFSFNTLDSLKILRFLLNNKSILNALIYITQIREMLRMSILLYIPVFHFWL